MTWTYLGNSNYESRDDVTRTVAWICLTPYAGWQARVDIETSGVRYTATTRYGGFDTQATAQAWCENAAAVLRAAMQELK